MAKRNLTEAIIVWGLDKNEGRCWKRIAMRDAKEW